jgi:hypothetical protein
MHSLRGIGAAVLNGKIMKTWSAKRISTKYVYTRVCKEPKSLLRPKKK